MFEKPFRFTTYQTKKGIQNISGTTIPQGNPNNVNSTTSAPGSGTATTGQPKHISEIPIGVRSAELQKIDLVKGDPYKYYIYFRATNTGVWAKKTGTNAINDWPDGYVSNGVYYLTEKYLVSAHIELNSLTWAIIGEDEEINEIVPGTKSIKKEDAKIEVHSDYITIGYSDSYIRITESEINLITPSFKVNGLELGGE